MQAVYTIGHLEVADIVRTYAVVQHLVDTASLADWQAATATPLQRQRWLTVKDRSGVVRGLCFLYTTQSEAVCRLEVPVFAAVSLVDDQTIARDLLDVARSRALRFGCDSIHFWPAGRAEWVALVGDSRPMPAASGIIYDLRAYEG